MTARLRERDRHQGAVARRAVAGEDAVSPVVGMIMVLAISVVGISAILYWGLPAIDEMKANVEFRSAQTQFEELDATVKELVAGTTEKTAKRWQPTLVRGSLSNYNNTEPWLFAIETYVAGQGNDFVWANLSDGDRHFMIRSANATSNVKVEAYIVTGTSSATALNVTGGSAVLPAQMLTSSMPSWSAGDWKHFNVSTAAGQPQRLENATFKFRIFSGSTLIAEAWYAATGRIDFELNAGVGGKMVIANNGAVITGVNGGYALANTPPIPPPSNTSGVSRIFARNILMGGNVSVAGQDSFDVLITLYATATLASYDCARADRADCVTGVKYFNYGTYQTPWYAYLTNRNRGYGFWEESVTVGGTTIKYLEDWRPYQGFTLLQSSLRLSGG